MERDAASAGVSEVGGLFSIAEIRILICYILSTIKRPVPGRLLADTLHYEAIANYFEVVDSIDALTKSGHLECIDEKEDLYIATAKGAQDAETLKTTISYTVKDRAYSAAFKMVSRYNNAKATEFEITKENGRMYINCTALDGIAPFMSVKLMVSDEEQAAFVREKFIDNPSKIYSEIINMLTKK